MDFSNRESEFKGMLSEKAEIANSALSQLLDEYTEIEPRLKEAMGHALIAPGKRIRAALIMTCDEILSGQVSEDAILAACAMEMIHTYSLVHDDLPAMDDDSLRRGKPTVHVQFDEATAILAGDGLLTLAFEVLSTRISQPQTALKLIEILATVAGPSGMIAGQMADILSEQKIGDEKLLKYIHLNKTAKMFSGAAAMGAAVGGADDKQFMALTEFGLNIGLGFQITDDILDIESTSEQMGKTVGKDTAQGKLTYPAIVGMEKSISIADELARRASDCLKDFDSKADILRYLAMALLKRNK